LSPVTRHGARQKQDASSPESGKKIADQDQAKSKKDEHEQTQTKPVRNPDFFSGE
jgi:hypothetical protein